MIITTFIKLSHIDLIEVKTMAGKNIFDGFFEGKPDRLLAGAIALEWGLTPSHYHHDPRNGHDHKKYCAGGRKWLYLGLCSVLSDVIEYLFDNKYYYLLIDSAADVAVPDSDPHAREIEEYIKETLKRPEYFESIRGAARNGMLYDVLDTLFKDPLLPTPKINLSEYLPEPVREVVPAFLKDKSVDAGGLAVSLLGSAGISGDWRFLLNKEHIAVTLGLTAAEAIQSAWPTITIGVWYDIFNKAKDLKKIKEAEYKK
jgi:hypothetical protein